MILELCKGVHCVDLDESFQTHIYLQNLASIQPRMSPLKFAIRGRVSRTSRTAESRARPLDTQHLPRLPAKKLALRGIEIPEEVSASIVQQLAC